MIQIWKLDNAVEELRKEMGAMKRPCGEIKVLVMYEDVELAKELAKVYKGVQGVFKVARKGCHLTLLVNRGA